MRNATSHAPASSPPGPATEEEAKDCRAACRSCTNHGTLRPVISQRQADYLLQKISLWSRDTSYFVAVAEEGQFTRAAARVAVAQPAVSAQIRRLERGSGRRSFIAIGARSGSRAPAGALPHARAAIAAVERGRDEIASLRGVLRGRLRVGVAGPVDHRFTQALGDFHRRIPRLRSRSPRSTTSPSSRPSQVASSTPRSSGSAPSLPSRIQARVVATEPLVLAVGRGDRLSRRRTVTITQLREQPAITLVRGSGCARFWRTPAAAPASSPASRRRRAISAPSSSLPPKGSARRSFRLGRGGRRHRGARDHPPTPAATHRPGLERDRHVPSGAPSWRLPIGALRSARG